MIWGQILENPFDFNRGNGEKPRNMSTQVTAEKPTRNGKPTKNDGKIHHAINGWIHYFDWAIFQFAKVKDPKGLVTVAGSSGAGKRRDPRGVQCPHVQVHPTIEWCITASHISHSPTIDVMMMSCLPLSQQLNDDRWYTKPAPSIFPKGHDCPQVYGFLNVCKSWLRASSSCASRSSSEVRECNTAWIFATQIVHWSNRFFFVQKDSGIICDHLRNLNPGQMVTNWKGWRDRVTGKLCVPWDAMGGPHILIIFRYLASSCVSKSILKGTLSIDRELARLRFLGWER